MHTFYPILDEVASRSTHHARCVRIAKLFCDVVGLLDMDSVLTSPYKLSVVDESGTVVVREWGGLPLLYTRLSHTDDRYNVFVSVTVHPNGYHVSPAVQQPAPLYPNESFDFVKRLGEMVTVTPMLQSAMDCIYEQLKQDPELAVLDQGPEEKAAMLLTFRPDIFSARPVPCEE